MSNEDQERGTLGEVPYPTVLIHRPNFIVPVAVTSPEASAPHENQSPIVPSNHARL
jgi:hypothetical protein